MESFSSLKMCYTDETNRKQTLCGLKDLSVSRFLPLFFFFPLTFLLPADILRLIFILRFSIQNSLLIEIKFAVTPPSPTPSPQTPAGIC